MPSEKLSLKLFFVAAFFLLSNYATAQKNPALLTFAGISKTLGNHKLAKATKLRLNRALLEKLYSDKLPVVQIKLVLNNEEIILELKQANLFADNHQTIVASTLNIFAYKPGYYLQGKIKGKINSLAAISIFPTYMGGVISFNGDNYTLCIANNNSNFKTNDYLMYGDKDCNIPKPICETTDGNNQISKEQIARGARTNAFVGCPVNIYFEAANSIYTAQGNSLQNTVDYVTIMFNAVQTIYAAENISIQIKDVKVWDIPDPETALITSETVLISFAARMALGFNGDLAHYITYSKIYGGQAYLDVLCYGDRKYHTAISGNLAATYLALPNYSFTVYVVAHEIGHNFGSVHTQNCSWPGGAIDNCYTVEGGTCPSGPAPANGGTVMSYCHLVPAGVNFANGFGPLPGDRIRLGATDAAANGCICNCVVIKLLPSTANIVKCTGETYSVSATTVPAITATYQWFKDGNAIVGATNSTYTITSDGTYYAKLNYGICNGQTTSVTVVFQSKVLPAFTPLADICSGGTTPVLSNTSTNGISGTWSPSTVSNTQNGTYTFTPNANQCAVSTTLTQNIVNGVVPTFAALADICSGGTAPILPTTSNNGISGTWSPSTVSNTQNGTYTFTPNANQCAVSTTLTQNIVNGVVPTFTPLADICSGGTAPVLSNTSTNGISGTWSPSTVSNTQNGTYTFTPNANQCAVSTTLTQNIVNGVVPTFAALADICSGGTAPILPTTSNNGISGTWSPSTVSNTQNGTYTFTPNANQCAVSTTLTQNIVNGVVPTFAALADICSGGTAPILPTTSNNGISGTWSPSTVSNTQNGTYTFTPNANQCAVSTTLTQKIVNGVVPTFTALTDICSGGTAPILSNTSTNGISGTWSPSTVSNTQNGTYTFTPHAGQCAVTTSLTQKITKWVLPTFTALADICSGSTAPVLSNTSTNGISGTWSPAIVSNTQNGTYTFTPNAGQCAFNTTITQKITAKDLPAFTALADICSGSTAPVLSNTSTNGISGTWSPATVSNTQNGTYTFTPNTGQCASTSTLSQKINQRPVADAGKDKTVLSSAPFQLNGSGGILYKWTQGEMFLDNANIPNPTARIFEDQIFTLLVTGVNGCTNSDQVFIKIYTGPVTFIPNSFTPNGDKLNDVFKATNAGLKTMELFTVWNRWGKIIFSTSNVLKGWDGTYKGQLSPMGSYIYQIKGTNEANNTIIIKGTINLIR